MCGIAGIVNKNNQPVNSFEIDSLTDIVDHRGPDGRGVFAGENFALGHRRLAILDLSDAGHQPMKYGDDYWIVFNGEIYNFIEIRAVLIKAGYDFKSGSDTEVILAAYAHWGENCVSHFNGMWAFALYDEKKNILFCSRDRFGVKPFYYSQDNGRFIFGSEIKQLLQFVKPRVNVSTLINYLVLGLESYSEETFFSGIQSLLPGHNLIYSLNDHVLKINKYYSVRIDPTLSTLSEDDSVSMFRDSLYRSIRLRLRSDVPVGTCLSGGLDSSAIAAIAGEMYHSSSGKKFAAITAQSSDPARDESNYAKMVVDKANLQWHVVKPHFEDFKSISDKVIESQEEPFGSTSIIFQYFVMQLAKQTGNTVLLDGQGGDETLLGYERYYPSYILSLPLRQKLRAMVLSSRNSKLSLSQLLLYHLYFTMAPLRLRRQINRASFIRDSFIPYVDREIIHKGSESYRDIVQMQLLEITSLQLPHLLKYEDKNSMLHSIETRLPFLDYQLVELSLSLNNRYKIKDGWTKYILRKAAEPALPVDVAWRKNKFGFEAPSSQWLKDRDFFMKEILSSTIIHTVSDMNLQKIDNEQLWKLYNVARWEKLYNVSIN